MKKKIKNISVFIFVAFVVYALYCSTSYSDISVTGILQHLLWIFVIGISFVSLHLLFSLFAKIPTSKQINKFHLTQCKSIPTYLLALGSFIVMPLWPYYFFYKNNAFIPFYICELTVFLFIVLLIGTKIYLVFGKDFKTKIHLRIMTYEFYFILLGVFVAVALLFSVLNKWGIVNVHMTTIKPSFIFTIVKNSGDVSLFVMFCFVLPQIDNKKINDKIKYVLLLRTFMADSKMKTKMVTEKIKSALPYGLSIQRVGNPKTLLSLNRRIETYYLENTEWKNCVKSLIKDAEVVFCIFDTTEGLLWETFENIEWIDKYIYYVENTNRINDLWKIVDKEGSNIDKPLFHAFEKLQANFSNYNDVCLFYEKNHFYLSSEIDKVVSFKTVKELDSKIDGFQMLC